MVHILNCIKTNLAGTGGIFSLYLRKKEIRNRTTPSSSHHTIGEEERKPIRDGGGE